MGNLLYLVAVVLVILWVIGFFFQGFGPNVGSLIHVLLVIAVIAIILKIINRAA
ncbi:lmo0937 family membrane protein [Pedobacter sp. PLR]|uniref:lmo0937 family membrane protein n=1 Tax=Pedobacter TaxID=84567 RepID=UPI002247D92E|nr:MULTISPECIES: lmo0937 family membrane protein [Pedobacter]MCX2450240.1 lmo0937 family membrane protein [Pedobacter sp. PLR]